MPRTHPATLLRVNLLLAVLGAAMGALISIPLTRLGHLIFQAPWALPIEIFLWNMMIVAILGAVLGPPLAWGALRRVPIRRAASETATGVFLGALTGLLLASVTWFLVFATVGTCLAAWRLQRRYGVPAASLPVDASVSRRPEVGSSRVDLQACKLEYSIVSPK